MCAVEEFILSPVSCECKQNPGCPRSENAAAPGIFRHNEIKKNKDLQSANLSKGSSSLKLDLLRRQIMALYKKKKLNPIIV